MANLNFFSKGKPKNFLQIRSTELIACVSIPCPCISKKPTSRQAFSICLITIDDFLELNPFSNNSNTLSWSLVSTKSFKYNVLSSLDFHNQDPSFPSPEDCSFVLRCR